ncbi:Short-chain dehydrogenase [Cyclonatronum proteinivorum]|uniref:Short-chain dehydrogenase n=1 Tax=Cyclonatronum proteinivorum TaxID=1457365 RepID=A0A345ULI1_9BACT|nr:SDR family oxidoreductase [Cyclonatronum proteinivorum]AXJ01333.1 Short-chain dehydrogenase [Cyclonatronum proteinivorum]
MEQGGNGKQKGKRKSLRDSVVWITGASSGIGEAMAYDFSRMGARIILSARRTDELERVKRNCEGPEENIRIIPLDLSETDSLTGKASEAIACWGEVDVLLNNGGMSQRALAAEAEMPVIRRIMEVNFFGTIALTQAILPHFIARKSGYVIVISSVMGKIGTKYRSTYAASKHALQGWYDCLRQEMYEHDVDVSLVCPGFVKTSITLNSLTADGKTYARMGDGQSKAMSAETFSRKLIPKLEKRKAEIFIGGPEIATVWLKRLSPALLNAVLKRAKVT